MIDPREKLPPLTLTAEQQRTHKIVTEYHNDTASFASEIAQLVKEKKRGPKERTVYLERIMRFKDNVQDGERRAYYLNGMIWSVDTWKDGLYWSIEMDFLPDGSPNEGAYLREGNGYVKHNNAQGQITGEGPYQNGKVHGHWIYRHPNGTKKGEGRVEGTERLGTWKWYNEKGELYILEEYEPEGDYQKNFWPDMKLKSVGYYIKNEYGSWIKTGIWREYDERGTEKVSEYDNKGILIPVKKV